MEKDVNFAQQFAVSHVGELQNVMGSDDGQKVKAFMEQDGDKIKNALQSGDIAALKNTFNSLMGTPEGARLVGELRNMIK